LKSDISCHFECMGLFYSIHGFQLMSSSDKSMPLNNDNSRTLYMVEE
jgi:hypothetical protein